MITFTALRFLDSLPVIDSAGQSELGADRKPHLLNNKAENYPFHTRLNNIMAKRQVLTSWSGSGRISCTSCGSNKWWFIASGTLSPSFLVPPSSSRGLRLKMESRSTGVPPVRRGRAADRQPPACHEPRVGCWPPFQHVGEISDRLRPGLSGNEQLHN